MPRPHPGREHAGPGQDHRLGAQARPARAHRASQQRRDVRRGRAGPGRVHADQPEEPVRQLRAAAHQVVQVYREVGVSISSAILFNHESPRRPETFVSRRISRGVARIARGSADPLTLGNLDARRDWGHARDVVRALHLIARHDRADDFVIGTGVSRSVADFVSAAFAHVGIENWRDHVQVDDDLLRPTDAPERCADSQKAAHELGWQPETTFEAMVAEMVDTDLQSATTTSS